jgi:hypothetical protein
MEMYLLGYLAGDFLDTSHKDILAYFDTLHANTYSAWDTLHREIYMLRYLAQLLGRQRQQLLVCEGPA